MVKSVRARITIASVLILGTALVIGGIAMVMMLRRSLTDDARAAAVRRAEIVARAFPLELPLELDTVDLFGHGEEEFIQIVEPSGDVTSSLNIEGEPPIADLSHGDDRRVFVSFEDDPFLAVGYEVKTEDGVITIIAGRTLESVIESTRTVTLLLAIGIPLLLVVVGVVAWYMVGRALGPVDDMRAEVDAISMRDLHRRVPDPEGQDEISRLAQTMNRMLGRLQSGHERTRRFVSDASHELRSPVTTIRQHAEVALAHPDRSSLRELAEVVLDENTRVQRLVEDLLLLTRFDEGTLGLEVESVDLDDVVLEEAERVRGASGVRVDGSGVSAGRVSGDRDKLSRLVRNLIENAVRHGQAVVAVGVNSSNGRVSLTVDDDGPGIPVAERERVFERFVRLDEARGRDSGGTGLGLAIVQEIAAAHGATVSISDAQLGGARFEVHFPAP